MIATPHNEHALQSRFLTRARSDKKETKTSRKRTVSILTNWNEEQKRNVERRCTHSFKAASSRKRTTKRRTSKVTKAFSMPSVSPVDSFGIWAVLLGASHFGLWSEGKEWGASLGGACLISALTTLVLANVGVIPHGSVTYDQVNNVILPMAVPLLLFSANLRVVFKSTGRLIPLFALGSIGTVLGGILGFLIVPLKSLELEAWKVCAALTARHIGGAVNYVAVANVLNVSPKVLGAGLAADNLFNVLYFALLFYLARDAEYVSDETSMMSNSSSSSSKIEIKEDSSGKGFSTYKASSAIAFSAILCYVSKSLSVLINGSQSLTIPIATIFSVLIATTFPKQCKDVAQSAEALAALAMNAFFATVGASGSISDMLSTAPSLFFFSATQVLTHLAFLLLAAKLLKFRRSEALIASNANVGGPTTAAAMAASLKWSSLVVPGMLVGVLGYAIATFIGIAFGELILKRMILS